MESWALCLVPLLSGKAHAAYVAMDILDTRDYAKVKQAILNIKYKMYPKSTDSTPWTSWRMKRHVNFTQDSLNSTKSGFGPQRRPKSRLEM